MCCKITNKILYHKTWVQKNHAETGIKLYLIIEYQYNKQNAFMIGTFADKSEDQTYKRKYGSL